MSTINNRRTARLLTASALAISLVAIAQPALAGISVTKHNLTGPSTSRNSTTNTDQICVFCHTPHGADISVSGAPLWNKNITTGATYIMYGTGNSATYDSGASQSTSPAGVSLACLTCHDGTQAMDNMLNAGGAGGFSTGGGSNGIAYTWTIGPTASQGGPTVNTTTGMLINGTGRQPVVGADLRNDHPIGMNYCASAGTTTVGTCVDVDFVAATAGTGRNWIDTAAGAAGLSKRLTCRCIPMELISSRLNARLVMIRTPQRRPSCALPLLVAQFAWLATPSKGMLGQIL